MSDNWLQFIPRDPDFIPTERNRAAALGLLKAWLPNADEVKADVEDEIQLVDAGTNLETIRCPACDADVEPGWWAQAADRAAGGGFRHRRVTMPCCAADTDLNDLTYDWPQGFARFALSAMNPDIANLDPGQEARLAETVGSPLRRIWTHV